MKIIRRGHYRNHGQFILADDDLTAQEKKCRGALKGPRFDKRRGVVTFCAVAEDLGEPGQSTHQYTVELSPREVLAMVRVIAEEATDDLSIKAVVASWVAGIDIVLQNANHDGT